MNAVRELAPAKLNLALSVGPPGPDRMHPICSWMVTIDLVDELDLIALPPGSLSRYAILWHRDAKRRTDIDWSIHSDLAVRAHLALERHVGRGLPLQMKLEKRIPVGGGLGGGSSNAAAMLRAVNRLYELDLAQEELAHVGASLGSDVPFLVSGGAGLVEGLGERIERTPPPELHAVVVFPPFGCPTGKVYAAFDQRGPAALNCDRVRQLAARHRPAPHEPFNDLAAPAAAVAPELSAVLQQVGQVAQRPVHVSGSGSTLFVLCDDGGHAQLTADLIEASTSLPAVAVRTYPAA
jgi:4-diphosphocytidyl-2-C-methyl-D-erythritol kinase